VLAGGQGSLTGRIFRLGHLGSVTVDDILAAMAIMEDAFEALGLPVERGASVAAAIQAAGQASGALPEAVSQTVAV